MKIKRIFAKDMRQALALVRENHGPEAVILSSKPTQGGVEVISAIDFDQAEVEELLARQQADGRAGRSPVSTSARKPVGPRQPADVSPWHAPATPERPVRKPARTQSRIDVSLDDALDDVLEQSLAAQEPAREEQARSEARRPAPEPVSARSPLADVEWTQEPAIREMRGEIKTLRSLFENQLSLMDWQKRAQQHPVKALLLRKLVELGLGRDICRKLVEQIADDLTPDKAMRRALTILLRHLPEPADDVIDTGGVIAMVGPTGVGKTTTVAKLAARYAMRHGSQHVALVTTDQFRIGAQEQLRNYARILGVPVHSAGNGRELGDVLTELSDRRLVLVDTAGMSQRDMRLAEQFDTLESQGERLRSYLVLSTSTQLATMSETVRAYREIGLNGCVLTKVDETTSLGAALTMLLRHRLPPLYLGTGQRVPEDLERARGERLVQRATDLLRSSRVKVDDEDLALMFGRPAGNETQ